MSQSDKSGLSRFLAETSPSNRGLLNAQNKPASTNKEQAMINRLPVQGFNNPSDYQLDQIFNGDLWGYK
ncbi:hypothetical protein [Psychrobacter sp. W2-37-MNA-CIBAN-0211]|uniref:hypothetical protein n=1 Tax=Psychrobacter sp. W2-37-MNA-CIBAN-0211 TaxID=3140443 RepID=UPI00332C4F1A